jgi:hypothetical protein
LEHIASENAFDDGLHVRPVETNPHARKMARKMVVGEARGNIAHAPIKDFQVAASQWNVFKEPEGWNLLSA